MNQRVEEKMRQFAQGMGLSFSAADGMLNGYYHGHNLCAARIAETYRMSIVVSVSQNGAAPDPLVVKKFVSSCKEIVTYHVTGYQISFDSKAGFGVEKCFANVKAAMEAIASFLSLNGYADCCGMCGKTTDLAAYAVNGAGNYLCSDCFQQATMSLEQNRTNIAQTNSNLIPGIVGALLGALLGVAAIMLIGQLGYVSALSGIVMGVCTLKGYEKLGGRIDTKGIIISVVIMLVMVYLGNNLDWAVTITRELDGFNLFEAFRVIPAMIKEGMIVSSSYFTSLGLVYLFTIAGAYPVIRRAIQTKDGNYAAHKIGSENETVLR